MSYGPHVISLAWNASGNLALTRSDGVVLTASGTPPVSGLTGVITKSGSFALANADIAGLSELTIYVNASAAAAVPTIDPALLYNATNKTSVRVKIKRDPADSSSNAITPTPKTGTTLEKGAAGVGQILYDPACLAIEAKDATTLVFV